MLEEVERQPYPGNEGDQGSGQAVEGECSVCLDWISKDSIFSKSTEYLSRSPRGGVLDKF